MFRLLALPDYKLLTELLPAENLPCEFIILGLTGAVAPTECLTAFKLPVDYLPIEFLFAVICLVLPLLFEDREDASL